jgi:hypothetical protein
MPRNIAAHLFALAALGLATASAGSALGISLEPAAPTWLEPVRVVVHDTRVTGCDSSAFSLDGPGAVPQGDGAQIDLTLSDHCPFLTPAAPHEIEASRQLGRLDQGRYTIRVFDPQGHPTQIQVTVRAPGPERITLPAAATDASPATLHVKMLFVAAAATEPSASVRVDGNVIEILARTWYPPPPIGIPPPQSVEVVDLPVTLPLLAAGDYEVRFIGIGTELFDSLVKTSLRVWDADGCVPDDDTLCLGGGRFRVEATWKSFDLTTGVGHGQILPPGDGSGLLWFFTPSNPELTVKVLDGCTLGGHYWVFAAAGTNVEYSLTVTDTHTGTQRRYTNPMGTFPRLVADTSAFDCD